jgi:chromosome segregation ATPase
MQAHSRALDERRQKLDALREDLERTQREILEQQMIVEQARASFADAATEEEAGHRVEQARKGLLDFHRQLAASTDERRQELQAALRQLQERRLAFRDEREALGSQLSEREAEIEQRSLRLHVQVVGLHERELQWRNIRERWCDEKRQAEEIIRQLVVQLESALEDREPPAPTTAGPESISDAALTAAA